MTKTSALKLKITFLFVGNSEDDELKISNVTSESMLSKTSKHNVLTVAPLCIDNPNDASRIKQIFLPRNEKRVGQSTLLFECEMRYGSETLYTQFTEKMLDKRVNREIYNIYGDKLNRGSDQSETIIMARPS